MHPARKVAIVALVMLLVPIGINVFWGFVHVAAGTIGGVFVAGVDEVDKDLRRDGGEDDPETSEELQEAKGEVRSLFLGGLALGMIAFLQFVAMVVVVMGMWRPFTVTVGILTLLAVGGWALWIDPFDSVLWYLISAAAGVLTIVAAVMTPPDGFGRAATHAYPAGYRPPATPTPRGSTDGAPLEGDASRRGSEWP